MKRALIALALTLVPSNAYCTDWQQVAQSPSGITEMDMSSIQGSKATGIVSLWVKVKYYKIVDQTSWSIEKWVIQCQRHQSKVSSFTTYDAEGRSLTTQDPYEENFKDTIPDSVAQGVEEIVCR